MTPEIRDPLVKQLSVQIGADTRKARLRARLSQTELAKMAGSEQGHISAIERGEINATVETIARLANALGHKIVISWQAETRAPRRK